jgi:hypothetical protein
LTHGGVGKTGAAGIELEVSTSTGIGESGSDQSAGLSAAAGITSSVRVSKGRSSSEYRGEKLQLSGSLEVAASHNILMGEWKRQVLG